MIAQPEVLVAQAREQTGLSDFGPDGWQEGLERLTAAAGRDIGTDAEAVARIEATATRRLVTRLRIEEWYQAHPGEGAHPVVAPVLILGLPRTATTALHHLLAVDPRFRYQRAWEVADPVPPPVLATEAHDPRRLAATGRPDDVRHISTADGPTEDVAVLGLHFHNQELGLPVPTYTRWWRDADLASTYAYQERVLRLLHDQRPPRQWLLKAPAYSFHLAQLAGQYPDARFLVTHRDPVLAFPSACSTILAAQRLQVPSCAPDPAALGRDLLEHFVIGTRRAIAARRQLGEERFCDIGQEEIDENPVATVERIYDFLGFELGADVQAAMAQWAVDNRRGVRGLHTYAPEDFGCTADEVRHAFGDYIERFGPLASSHHS